MTYPSRYSFVACNSGMLTSFLVQFVDGWGGGKIDGDSDTWACLLLQMEIEKSNGVMRAKINPKKEVEKAAS